MNHKHHYHLILTLIFLLLGLALTGCETPAIDGTFESRVATAVSATITAIPTGTAIPPPPTDTSPPPASATAAPSLTPTPLQPQSRRELLDQLGQIHTAVSDLTTTLQQLVDYPRPADQEWVEDVAVQADFIHAYTLALSTMIVPPQGRAIYGRLLTTVTFCDQVATAVTNPIADLEGAQEDLTSCAAGLLAFNDGSQVIPTIPALTPVPLVGCSQTAVGFIPLTDLGTGTFHGMSGGLYPDGHNERPPAHEAAGLAIAQTIQPLTAAGMIDAESGKIGFISVGMSNAALEFGAFTRLANADPEKNEALIIVNGAQGGWSSEKLAGKPEAEYWRVLDQRLGENGLTPAQVQIAWIKEARAGVKREPFPEEPQIFQAHLQSIVQILTERYPNLKLVYLSSRIYGGYATGPLNPEPFAYQTGFGVKWLIEAQINGDPALNYDPAKGEVKAPWLAWGPYLWADGLMPRGDGLFWACAEFAGDGTHPGDDARAKVAQMLLDFFKTDSTTGLWFLKD